MLFLVAGCQVEASVLSILEVVLLGSVLERSKPAGSCSHTKQSTSVFSRRPKGRADYILRPEHGADEQQSLPRQREAALHPSQHTGWASSSSRAPKEPMGTSSCAARGPWTGPD